MYTLNCRGKLLRLERPVVMGILNTTPDSFYSTSRVQSLQEVVEQADKMLAEGAAILDIGGQSTRPGSKRVSPREEIDRVLPGISAILSRHPDAILSIDTYAAEVAAAAVEAGAAIINDISGGDMDPAILSVAAAAGVPYICMHMQGRPDTMQNDPQYQNVTLEVLDYLSHKIAACRAAGIRDVVADPGFGFGKTIRHNFTLLKEMAALEVLEVPILAGLSRKSSVYTTLQVTPEEALNGTTVLNTLALMNGASILRVHDVRAAVEAIQLVSACQAMAN